MICDAEHTDAWWIMEAAPKFFAESMYADMGEFDPTTAEALFHHLVDSENGIVFVDREKRAFFAGEVLEHFFAKIKYAYDHVLWVPPAHRGNGTGFRLLKKYVERAEQLGANEIFAGDIGSIDQKTLFKLHEKLGFTERTKQYSKRVGER